MWSCMRVVVCGRQNELRYLRIRAKKQEVMVAFGE